MRRRATLIFVSVVPLLAPGCGTAPAPEPAAPVHTTPGEPVTVSGSQPSGQPASQTAAPRSSAPEWVLGAWSWERDVVVFREDGSGVYYRDGGSCYKFDYSVESGALSIRAHEDSSCQGRRNNDYRIELRDGRMEWTHVGSDYRTTWERSREPPPQL